MMAHLILIIRTLKQGKIPGITRRTASVKTTFRQHRLEMAVAEIGIHLATTMMITLPIIQEHPCQQVITQNAMGEDM